MKRVKGAGGVGLIVAALVAAVAVAWAWVFSYWPPERPESRHAGSVPSQPIIDGKVEVPQVTLTRRGNRPLRVLIAGDSVSQGFYADEADEGFADLLLASLRRSGPVEAQYGQQEGGSLSTVGGLVVDEENLDLAVIELGTNDVGLGTPPVKFRRQYETLVNALQKRSPNLALVCLGPWTNIGRTVGNIVEEVCEAESGVYVPLSRLFSESDYRGPEGRDVANGVSDNFHPNTAGHAAIADRILEHITVVSAGSVSGAARSGNPDV